MRISALLQSTLEPLAQAFYQPGAVDMWGGVSVKQSHGDEVSLWLTNLDCSRSRLFTVTSWCSLYREVCLWNPSGCVPAHHLQQEQFPCLLPLAHFNVVHTLWWCVSSGPQLTLCCARCTGGIPQWHSCKCSHESQFMVTTLGFNFPWELWPDSGLEPGRKLENCFQVLSVKIKNTCWALRRKKAVSLGGLESLEEVFLPPIYPLHWNGSTHCYDI